MEAQQWATREEVQALTAAQAQDREEFRASQTQDREEFRAAQAQERERISRLEVQVGESVRATDKYGATKADVTAVLVEVEKVRSDVEKVRSDVEAAKGEVRSDIRVLRIWLFVGVLALAFLDNIPWVDVLRLLLRFGG